MDRIKTFLKYALLVIICYFGSNTLIYAAINNTYDDIASYEFINSDSISVNTEEAKATSVNGYIKGTIENKSLNKIDETYIRIDFFSDKNVHMGSKYLKIENLDSKDSEEFNINFKYSNVSYCVISNVDKI